MAIAGVANFVLPLLVFLSTAWANQYQDFYQQHFKNPSKSQLQYIYPPEPQTEGESVEDVTSETPYEQSQSQSQSQQEGLIQQSEHSQQFLSQQSPLQQSLPNQSLSHQSLTQITLDSQEQQEQGYVPLSNPSWLQLNPYSSNHGGVGGGLSGGGVPQPGNNIHNSQTYPAKQNPVYHTGTGDHQWSVNSEQVHNIQHQHGSHMHAPHQHHPQHGSKVRPEEVDVYKRPYCETRFGGGGQCCPGRQDSCNVPILDTVCYCDVFCNRTVADCCPDFWSWCMGVESPKGAMGHGVLGPHLPLTEKKAIVNNCKFKNKYYNPASSIRINCNNCTCVEANMGSEYNWQCSQKICLIRDELIEHISKGDFGWHATNYTFFWGMTLDEGVSHKLGTKRPIKTVKQMASMHVTSNDVLPEQFDGRQEWGDLLHPIQDQGNCGASWVFSTTSVAADRFSLHSGGQVRDTPSPQHLLSCNRDHMQHGCDGGHLDRAWWFMRQNGLVDSSCYPYRSGVTSESGTCLLPAYRAKGTRVTCPTKGRRTSLIYQVAPPYRIAPSEREIMKEIQDNGPVQATVEVKEDFFMYKGGVYRYSLPAIILPPNHRVTGFHSVRVIGWGVDRSNPKPLKYWLCANSWGTKWGEDGFFRIARGEDECKIESFIVGVWGKLNGRPIVRSKGSKSSKIFIKKRRPFVNKKKS